MLNLSARRFNVASIDAVLRFGYPANNSPGGKRATVPSNVSVTTVRFGFDAGSSWYRHT